LKTPTDLTKLSAVNGGTFPAESVYETIIGRKVVETHGTREMPVWGPSVFAETKDGSVQQFQAAVPGVPGIVRVRLIVDYIATLQGK
jgi:hypothetical protein